MSDSTQPAAGGTTGPSLPPSLPLQPLSRVRLDDLLQELLDRVEVVVRAQERLRALLDAVVGIATDLDLRTVLERIVTAACSLADARYGALGVLGAGGELSDFVTYGVTEEERARIGPPPKGHGILGVLIHDPRPLRLPQLGDHPLSYGFPPNHPPMSTFLGVPLRIRNQVFGNLYLTEKIGGGEFTDEDEEIVVALAAAAGVAIENARLYEQSGRRQRWLEAAAEITGALLADVDRTAALELVAQRAREVAEADLAAILLPHAGSLVVEVADGLAAPDLRGRRMRAGADAREHADDVCSAVLASGHATLVEDLEAEAPWRVGGALGPGLAVPLASSAGPLGVLLVAVRRGAERRFTDADVRLVGNFAGQAALALERARSQEDRERLAVFEDRDRIARDLHDLVIQRLFATGLQLQGASRLVDRPDVAGRLSAAVDDLDATIRDIRATIFQLQARPGEGDLRAEVRRIVDGARGPLGFAARLTTSGPLDTAVPAEIRPHLLAVLREGLINAARHARAAHVDVVVETADGMVRVVVADDGRGVGEPERQSGLRNLRERAASLGGSLRVRPADPSGTVLEWEVPLPA